jgi:hypothetical protein
VVGIVKRVWAEREEGKIYRDVMGWNMSFDPISAIFLVSCKYQKFSCQDLASSKRIQNLRFDFYAIMASSDLERCTSYGRGGAGNLRRPSVVAQAKEILASMPSNDSENCTSILFSCSWSEC